MLGMVEEGVGEDVMVEEGVGNMCWGWWRRV